MPNLIEAVEQARIFAIRAHGNQMYGQYPYSWHLDAVADSVSQFGTTAQIVAYLHDTLEDTATSSNTIKDLFGEEVANCVLLLSDPPGESRQARKLLSHKKLARATTPLQVALIVKAADRLANVKACLTQPNKKKWNMYKEEHPEFRAAAYRQGLCEAIWNDLDFSLSFWPL